MYVAVIRRVAGGAGVKTAKHTGQLFFPDTCIHNLQSFVQQWPKHLTTFLCYGRSQATESRAASLAVRQASRSYGQLACRAEEAEEQQSASPLNHQLADDPARPALP